MIRLKDLLTEDGNSLRKEYEMDGTHMNPSYLTLLEKLYAWY